MCKLDESLELKFDSIVNYENISKIEDKINEYFSEEVNESVDYKRFYEEFNKLYSSEYSQICIYRIDKVLDLFKEYLYVNDEVCISKNLFMADYVKIALYYFEFLHDNYFENFFREYEGLGGPGFNMDFDIAKFKEKINFLYDMKIKENLSNTNYEKKLNNYDEVYSYQYLLENLTNFWNPFDKKMVRDLIKLYHIVKNNVSLVNNIHIDINQIEDLIIYYCQEYNAVEEAFDFLVEVPSCLNCWLIQNVYDTFSARLVYNILQDLIIKFDYYNNQIVEYYNRILKILEVSSDTYIIEVYRDIKKHNILEFKKLEDKILLFRNLEKKVFEKIGIHGTYSDYYEIFFDYNSTTTESLIDNLILSIDDDLLAEDYIPKVNYENDDDELNNDSYYNYSIEDHLTENKLRIIYQEAKGFFGKLALNIHTFKFLKNEFDSIDDISNLLKDSQEIYREYEMQDVSKYYEKYINDNYNSETAINYLRHDLESLNILDIDNKIDELLKNSRIRKTILSASNWWNIYEKTQNMSIDKDGQDYTPLVANYFKTVELLLFKKIKDLCINNKNNNIQFLSIYKVNGIKADIIQEDNLTLGEMIKYIRREKRIIKPEYDNIIFADLLQSWVENVRNSHFHKDLITTKSEVLELKNQSIKIIDDILCYFEN